MGIFSVSPICWSIQMYLNTLCHRILMDMARMHLGKVLALFNAIDNERDIAVVRETSGFSKAYIYNALRMLREMGLVVLEYRYNNRRRKYPVLTAEGRRVKELLAEVAKAF